MNPTVSGWPVTIEGRIHPSRGGIKQYEIGCNTNFVSKLPLMPYEETVGEKPEGIPVTCKYKNQTVTGRFHRKLDDKGAWIYTNRLRGGPAATDNWYIFLSSFGITKGISHPEIPVYLDFYDNLSVVIRALRPTFRPESAD